MTGVILIVFFLFGLFSLFSMELDLLPEINLPVAVVATAYDNAGPAEVEAQVTRLVESAMATVGGVDTLRSTSSEGSSLVIVNLGWGTDLDVATSEMRETLDRIRNLLPDGAGQPRVIKLDPGLLPVVTLSLAGSGRLSDIQETAEDVIIPRLERIEGVASVDLAGGRERQIQVRLDPDRMTQYALDFETIGQILMASNLNLPGGTLAEGNRGFTLRTLGEFTSVADIAQVLIPTANGGAVRLEDIAQVIETEATVQSITRLDSDPSIALSIRKESGANTVMVSSRVREEMAALMSELPPDLRVVETMDQGRFVVQSIQNVLFNGLIGGLLAIVVLFLFLRDWRSTLVTAIAIPFAAIVSFTFIYFMGLTMNLLSMGGLALGIGMMVDNAIVVLENVFRKLKQGLTPAMAAVEGTTEVGAAITASTLTTLSVFIPIIFTEGLAAEIFGDLSLTISAALGASLLIALTGIPLIASRLLRRVPKNETDEKTIESGRGLAGKYRGFLGWSLSHRGPVIGLLVLTLALGALAIPFIETEFLPEMDDGQILVDVRLPPGTTLTQTDVTIEALRDRYRDLPEVAAILTYSGTSAGGGMGAADTAQGQLQLTLVDLSDRRRNTSEIAENIRTLSSQVPGCEVSVQAGMMAGMGDAAGGFGGPAVTVEIRGEDLGTLEALTGELAGAIETLEGTSEIRTSFDEGAPELQLIIDRTRAADLGITPAQIARTVRAASMGETVTRVRLDGSDLDVLMRLDEDHLSDRTAVLHLPLRLPTGVMVPLMEVADLVEAVGPSTIERTNQARSATVTAHVTGRSASAVNAEVAELGRALSLPPGYTLDLEGEQALMQESFSVLTWVAILGFVLMYLIMAAQFESFVFPLSVILTVPMSLIGIAVVLAVTGRTFDVGAFVGMIMVMGIIVNNAIVMVDYTNQLRQGGMDRRTAMLTAGSVRMRPVLMTALTTVLAMIPLSLGLGEGAEMQVPLATTVMAGLATGTLLTLVVLPVLYTLIDDLANGQQYSKKEEL